MEGNKEEDVLGTVEAEMLQLKLERRKARQEVLDLHKILARKQREINKLEDMRDKHARSKAILLRMSNEIKTLSDKTVGLYEETKRLLIENSTQRDQIIELRNKARLHEQQ